MIVTLTPNPALDLTYHLSSLAVGASQRVPPAQLRAGGKGINVARVLHAQGSPVHVVAPVGGSTGEAMRADLDRAGLPCSLLETGLTTRHTVALVTPTETTNLNESGPALTGDHWDQLADLTAAALDGAGPAPVLVCSGSMPADAPPDAISRMVEIAHARGARCLVDTSGPHLLAAADAGADVLKPNHHELLAVMGGADVLGAARALATRSGGVVFASLGAAGLLRVPGPGAESTEGPALHARLPRALSGNTTGAGDAAVAAIAASLTVCATPTEALRLATAWSGAAVLHPLAGSLTDPTPLLAEITISPATATPHLED